MANARESSGNRPRMGIRERILRCVGAGYLYDRLIAATSLADSLAKEIADLRARMYSMDGEAATSLARTSSVANRLERFESLSEQGKLIELEYAIKPKMRHGGKLPEERHLAALLTKGDARYRSNLERLLPFVDRASQIPARSDIAGTPHWVNDWLPAFDAISLYAQVADRNPALYLEIGSGTSTKFVRQAISDFNLRTKIVSIDPYPRSEIDAICDEIIRLPLEDATLSVFNRLQPGDVLFFDGSHRSFQNSDVTVFFTEILPAIYHGVLVGVHDVLLPSDYPEDWIQRHYNEQYLLACWLLGGDRLQVELPLFYCSCRPQLSGILDPLWKSRNVKGAPQHGCAFWFTPTSVTSKTDSDASSGKTTDEHDVGPTDGQSDVMGHAYFDGLLQTISDDFKSEVSEKMLAAAHRHIEHFAGSEHTDHLVPVIEQASAHLYLKWLNGQTSDTIHQITETLSIIKVVAPESAVVSAVYALSLFESGDHQASEREINALSPAFELPALIEELLTKASQQINDQKQVNSTEVHRAGLLLLDNAFPSKASSFRYGEFSSYLRHIPDSRYAARPDRNIFKYGEESHFAGQVSDYVLESGTDANRIRTFSPNEIDGSKVAYCVFLNLASLFFSQFELKSVDHLIFTLYPGGGFALRDERSDSKLRKICEDKRLAKIITTQKTTYDYLIDNNFCGSDRIQHIFGGVVPAAFNGKFDTVRAPKTSGPVDVCFVAHRYTAVGAEKGYDIFCEVVKILSNSPRFHFHVVGDFDNAIIDLKDTRNITFYGTRNADFFPSFYSRMDVIVSPAIQMSEIDPSVPAYFDGFPTTCVIEAGLHGAAMLTTDFLNMNQHLDGTPIFSSDEMKIIERDAPAISTLLAQFEADRTSLAALGECGRKALLREFSFERQMKPRIALLESYLSK